MYFNDEEKCAELISIMEDAEKLQKRYNSLSTYSIKQLAQGYADMVERYCPFNYFLLVLDVR